MTKAIMNLCPICKGSLYLEKETDGIVAVCCINGHRFEPVLPPTMPVKTNQLSWQERLAVKKAERFTRNQEIKRLCESGITPGKLARRYHLCENSILHICSRGHT